MTRPWVELTDAEKARVRYLISRDRILKYKRRYYRENRDRIRAQQAEYRAKHPHKQTPARRKYTRLYMQEWRKR